MADNDYWVSFRIHDDAGYEKRYDALIEAVQKNASLWWAETTSFFCARSSLDTDAFGAKLKAAINAKTDLVIMRKIGADSARYSGEIKDQDYFKFFPNAKKL